MPTRSPLIALALAALVGCGEPAPQAVLPSDLESLEPGVRSLVIGQLRAIEEHPADPAKHMRLALIYEANNMYGDSARAYERVLEMDPQNHLARFHRAISLQATGDAETFLTLVEEVAAALPDEPAVQHRLGLALLDADRLDEAEAAFERLKQLTPGIPLGDHGLGQVALARGDGELALEHLERAMPNAQGTKAILYDYGQALREVGRKDEAKRYLTEGLNAEPVYMNDPLTRQFARLAVTSGSQLMRADQLAQSGQLAEAALIYERLMTVIPGDPAPVERLVDTYLALEHPQRALELVQARLQSGSVGAELHEQHARCLLALEDPAGALAAAERASELAPNAPETQATLAQALSRNGRLADSEQVLLELTLGGMQRFERGDRAGARSVLKAVQRVAPARAQTLELSRALER